MRCQKHCRIPRQQTFRWCTDGFPVRNAMRQSGRTRRAEPAPPRSSGLARGACTGPDRKRARSVRHQRRSMFLPGEVQRQAGGFVTMTLTAIRVPEWVHDRAVVVLSQYRKQRLNPLRIIGTGNLSLKVNHRWRLLSKDNGKNWQLMSHEKYNAQKDR